MKITTLLKSMRCHFHGKLLSEKNLKIGLSLRIAKWIHAFMMMVRKVEVISFFLLKNSCCKEKKNERKKESMKIFTNMLGISWLQVFFQNVLSSGEGGCGPMEQPPSGGGWVQIWIKHFVEIFIFVADVPTVFSLTIIHSHLSYFRNFLQEKSTKGTHIFR